MLQLILQPSSEQKLYKSILAVPPVLLVLSVLRLTLPAASEAALKLQTNVTIISVKTSQNQASARGGERKEETFGLDLERQCSAGDSCDRKVQREVRLLQNVSADSDTDPLMQPNVFRPTFQV